MTSSTVGTSRTEQANLFLHVESPLNANKLAKNKFIADIWYSNDRIGRLKYGGCCTLSNRPQPKEAIFQSFLPRFSHRSFTCCCWAGKTSAPPVNVRINCEKSSNAPNRGSGLHGSTVCLWVSLRVYCTFQSLIVIYLTPVDRGASGFYKCFTLQCSSEMILLRFAGSCSLI